MGGGIEGERGERDRDGERAPIIIFVGVPFFSSVADVACNGPEEEVADGKEGGLMGVGW